MARVFVYGTLRRGEVNAGLLEGSRYLGVTSTRRMMTLVHVAGVRPYDFPAAVWEPPTVQVVGEVHDVDDATLARLDRLEDCPRLYQRRRVELVAGGAAWIYVMRERPDGSELARGDWLLR